MTLLSRVLGLGRDIVIANYFGAGSSADAFFVAFRIPNFFRRLFAEGAFSQAFVPVLSEYRVQQEHKQVQHLVNHIAGTLGGILVSISVIAVIAAPLITIMFAPGFYIEANGKFELAVDMLRITFPYLCLISLTAFAGAVLNSYERFAVPAFTPVLLNLSLIGSAVFLSPLFDPPVLALAWGVLIAGTVQLLFQLPFMRRINLLPTPVWGWQDAGVKRVIKLMIPALFGVSVTQISLLLDTVLASFLQTGSVSWLYYSDRLVELPLGIFGIAIATVILPSLSRRHASKSVEQFSSTLNWAIQMVMLIGFPATIALVIMAKPLLITLFHYGALTDHDVDMAAMSLRAYACGLLAFMLIKVLATGYFSRQDTRTPVKIGIKAAIANMLFNLILIIPLAHAGLAAATALSAFMNAGLLLRGLLKEGVFRWSAGWGKQLIRMFIANLIMAILLIELMPAVTNWLTMGIWQRIQHMGILVIAGACVYGLVLILLGLRPSDLKHRTS